MGRLLSGIILSLAALPVHAFVAAQEAPGSDSGTVVWILVGVFVFFGIVLGFTWQLVKNEHKERLENKDR